MPDHKAIRGTLSRRAGAVLGTGLFVLLAACGSDEPAAPASVATRDHAQLGRILTDTSGRTLYFADQEADGTLRCVEGCLEVWVPATVPDGERPAGDGVADLGVLRRSDNGQNQLTYQGKPLYRFELDSAAGEAKGDNAQDDFNGTHFVWHAVAIGQQPDAPAPTTGDGGYGY
jgi:predicted lipoprotein with Yx(FWY)xxD motif